jgi:MoxR-like ATPase
VSSQVIEDVRASLRSVIRGKDEAIDLMLLAVVAGGHVLVEDVPGVGKTTLAKALARTFDVEFSRVQFTPDLLPADILGTQILDPREGTFSFHPGPIFTTILLADEINRASPRTQSALLEAMNEEQVTVDGTTRRLPEPFTVVATQNPVDFQGTYPLPEAQLDRFMLRIELGYPDEASELGLLRDRQTTDPIDALEPVASRSDLLQLQQRVREVEMREPVARYLLHIVRATRDRAELALGVSPRGALSLFRGAQARAFLDGRVYATPDDVKSLATVVLGHRVMASQEAAYGGGRADRIIARIVDEVDVPT